VKAESRWATARPAKTAATGVEIAAATEATAEEIEVVIAGPEVAEAAEAAPVVGEAATAATDH